MTIEAILSRLHKVRREGTEWKALCPAHADKNPSLSVREESGKVLLHCFAGCAVEAICVALEMTTRDLFSEPRKWHKSEPPVVRSVRQGIADLRGGLTPLDRERAVTVVLANETNLDAAIARALALAVEGEIVQATFSEGGQ